MCVLKREVEGYMLEVDGGAVSWESPRHNTVRGVLRFLRVGVIELGA